MRAEEVTRTVNFRLSELDRESGASVKYSTGKVTLDEDLQATVGNLSIGDTNIPAIGGSLKSFVEGLVRFTRTSEASSYTDVTVVVYDNNGRFVDEWSNSTASDWESLYLIPVSTGYTVELSLTVDRQSAGERYVGATEAANPDGIDDRDQAVITVLKQHAIDSSVYDRPDSESYYVVNKGDNVAKMIKDGDYYNFPYWSSVTTDDDGNYYVYAYDNALTKVTGDLEVKANWVEDEEGVDRFAPAATNDKDTNGDGKVSCDEYYGTTGLVWSDEKNACVVESNGAVVVTIPNTATK